MSPNRICQHINAPPEMVYPLLIDPTAVSKWRVPDGMTCLVHEFDAREGGRFRVSLTYDSMAQAGKSVANTDTYRGTFERLVKNDTVVEVLEFETENPALVGVMTITTTLVRSAGGTDVSVNYEGVPDGVSVSDNERGTRIALAKLAALAES